MPKLSELIPLPATVEAFERPPVARVRDAKGDYIGTCLGPDAAEKARAIARALNAHDDMLAALRGLDAYWREDYRTGPDGGAAQRFLHDSTRDVWRACRAATAKATEN